MRPAIALAAAAAACASRGCQGLPLQRDVILPRWYNGTESVRERRPPDAAGASAGAGAVAAFFRRRESDPLLISENFFERLRSAACKFVFDTMHQDAAECTVATIFSAVQHGRRAVAAARAAEPSSGEPVNLLLYTLSEAFLDFLAGMCQALGENSTAETLENALPELSKYSRSMQRIRLLVGSSSFTPLGMDVLHTLQALAQKK